MTEGACPYCPKAPDGPHYYYCRTTGTMTRRTAARLRAEDAVRQAQSLCLGGRAHPHPGRLPRNWRPR